MIPREADLSRGRARFGDERTAEASVAARQVSLLRQKGGKKEDKSLRIFSRSRVTARKRT